MPRVFEGELSASGLRIAVVASRFNETIVSKLLEGALECLARHGADEASISVYRVPGAFEIPAMAAELAATSDIDAIVTIGCLIRGDTPHFDFISAQTTLHISQVALESGVAVSFGVITCDTLDQALDRSRKGNNKGWEAALSAIEMANLLRAYRADRGLEGT